MSTTSQIYIDVPCNSTLVDPRSQRPVQPLSIPVMLFRLLEAFLENAGRADR